MSQDGIETVRRMYDAFARGDSGAAMENRFGMLYEVQDGMITRWTVYDDAQLALEAAGLSRRPRKPRCMVVRRSA